MMRPGNEKTPNGGQAEGVFKSTSSPSILAYLGSLFKRNRIWLLAFDLEEARQRYASSGKLIRQAVVCIALAVLRIAGVRYV